MIEQLKKVLSTGVGLALKTWTEVEAEGREMIKKAQLSEKDAGQFLKSLKESYETTQKKMESQVDRLVKDVIKKADIATNDDVKALTTSARTRCGPTSSASRKSCTCRRGPRRWRSFATNCPANAEPVQTRSRG